VGALNTHTPTPPLITNHATTHPVLDADTVKVLRIST